MQRTGWSLFCCGCAGLFPSALPAARAVPPLALLPAACTCPLPPPLCPQILLHNANNYSKGLLSEILEFVMGQGLIPADGEVWKVRRRTILPALHKKYLAAMLDMFGDCALHGADMLAVSQRVSATGWW